MELLAPAGGPEAARAALAAGADALYMGLGHTFNARKSAINFDDGSFAEICRLAHLAGSRVYLTTNVVIMDDEVHKALNLVQRAHRLGADAFIVQDFGLMSEIHRLWPDLEIHVSTQANIHDPRATRWCNEMGAERVTLSRELSLKEIEEIAQTGVELECFGHGAICFCYSGVCHMSSQIGGRSANRGACAQPCRLPYDLVDLHTKDVYGNVHEFKLLCPRDYKTIDYVAEMAEAGVGSLKIEGRMKNPDYVHAVVSAYRKAMDRGEKGAAPEELHTQLARAFNRSFTTSYLFGTSDNDMMSYHRSNNAGQIVGRVVDSVKLEDEVRRTAGSAGGRVRMRKYKRADVRVALDLPVGEGDLLELRDLDQYYNFLTAHVPADAAAGSEIVVRVARPLAPGAQVRVIRSAAACKAAEVATQAAYPRKRAVDVTVTLKLGAPLRIALSTSDSLYSAEVAGNPVEAARTKAITNEEVIEHVGRMGNTAFEPQSFDVELDEGVGLGFSELHKLRDQAAEALEHEILAVYEARKAERIELSYASHRKDLYERVKHSLSSLISDGTQSDKPAELCVLVATKKQAEAAVRAGAERIYFAVDQMSQIDPVVPEGAIPWFSEVARATDRSRIERLVSEHHAIAAGNLTELIYAQELCHASEVREAIPVQNLAAMAQMFELGAHGIWFTPELSLEELLGLASELKRACGEIPQELKLGFQIFGNARMMTCEHCILQATGECIHNCPACKLRQKDLALHTIDDTYLPVMTDIHGRSRIFNYAPFDGTPEMKQLFDAGFTRFMVDCSICDCDETARRVSYVRAGLDSVLSGKAVEKRAEGTLEGHLYSSIKNM